MKKNISLVTLIFITVIWGSAFIFQEIAGEHISGYTFNFLRFGIASIVLLPIAIISIRKDKKNGIKLNLRKLLFGSLLCGLSLSIASVSQQFGISLSSASKAGFITACYIVIVPLIALFRNKKSSINIYIAVILEVIGLYIFCINEDFKLQIGDLLLLLCAIAFAFQITFVEHYSKSVNNIALSFGQSFFSFIVCIIPTIIFERPTFTQIGNSILPVLYVAIFSTCVCYTLQITAQKNVNPVIASLIMSCEAIFSAVFGYFILDQQLTNKESLGALIMIFAVMLSQLPSEWFGYKRKICKKLED